MTENAKKFIEAVSQNEEEKNAVNAMKTKEEVIAYAKEKGFTLTDEDFENAQPDGELSDDELDAVAGGDDCFCFVGGVGNYANDGDRYDDKCVCVVGGGGEDTHGDCRCACVVGGIGDSKGKKYYS